MILFDYFVWVWGEVTSQSPSKIIISLAQFFDSGGSSRIFTNTILTT